MKKVALLVGRFQPFHQGHWKFIQKVAKEKDVGKIIIAIGSSQFSNTLENPFSAVEREEMITASLKKTFFHQIVKVPDIDNNEAWVSHIENLVGKFDVVYTNSPLETSLFKKASYEVRATGLFHRENYSGTEIRRRILSGEKWQRLVPTGTLEVMEKIGAVERIKNVC